MVHSGFLVFEVLFRKPCFVVFFAVNLPRINLYFLKDFYVSTNYSDHRREYYWIRI